MIETYYAYIEVAAKVMAENGDDAIRKLKKTLRNHLPLEVNVLDTSGSWKKEVKKNN